MDFKSGFICIAGLANAGKSTLTNALVGEKVSIVSWRPQTTRNKLLGIINGDGYQMVLIDTPGIHKVRNHLGQYMMQAVENSLKDVDGVVYVIDGAKGMQKEDYEFLEKNAHKLGELRAGLIDVHFHLGLAHFRLHVFYEGDYFLYVAVGEQDGLQHFVLAQLVRARFNHHNRVLSAGNGQMQLALFALLTVRVDYILPVDIANAYRAGGAHEGRVAYGEGGA